jgi:hypothetical protein
MKLLCALFVAAACLVLGPVAASAEQTVDEICYLNCPYGGKLSSTLQCICYKKPPRTPICSVVCLWGKPNPKTCACEL